MGHMLTSQPKTFLDERPSQRCSTHTLTRFQIPLLHKHVVSRSKVSGSHNALQSEAASRARERRHLPGEQEVLLIDAVQKCLFSSTAWSFYHAIIASTGRRLGSPDALGSRSPAIMQHRTNGEIIPVISIHTCPLIFTSQRQFVWGSPYLHSLVLFICNRRRKGNIRQKQ